MTALILVTTGCANEDPIVKHKVLKNRSGLEGIRSARRPNIPDGWAPGTTSAMVPIRINKSFGEESAEITVIPLPADANDWESNAKRWYFQQLGLELDEESRAKLTTEVKVDGKTGKRIRLVDEKGRDGNAIIGIMVVQKDTAWFLKMMGPIKAVEQAEKDFDQFVEKFQFPE